MVEIKLLAEKKYRFWRISARVAVPKSIARGFISSLRIYRVAKKSKRGSLVMKEMFAAITGNKNLWLSMSTFFQLKQTKMNDKALKQT